jgi:hypothetical protein
MARTKGLRALLEEAKADGHLFAANVYISDVEALIVDKERYDRLVKNIKLLKLDYLLAMDDL